MTPSKTRVPNLPLKAQQEKKKLVQIVRNLFFLFYKQKDDVLESRREVADIVEEALDDAEY